MRYRTKAVTVEAVQWNGEADNDKLSAFCGHWVDLNATGTPIVTTAFGGEIVTGGAWVVRQGEGDYALMTPEAFAAKFHPAAEPPREITTHKVNDCNKALRVIGLDPASPGGAYNRYFVSGFFNRGSDGPVFGEVQIDFHAGPVADGVNGITHEVLTAILIDRLAAFQAGPFACQENEVALAHYREALAALNRRTEVRKARGVEGTHAV